MNTTEVQSNATTEPTNQDGTESTQSPPEGSPSGGAEFKITIRKLELPVRPRGVLAE